MKKVEEKIEYPRFIPTTPSGIDKFEGGSQKRLSETIAQHFQKNDLLGENALPRIIGIEGEWGSGKSNVVKMLREQLKGKYYFFEYDAWGHQEDLQRRSILELLTQELVKNNFLVGETIVEFKNGEKEKVTWPDKLKYLLARKSEAESLTYPRVSEGMVAAFLVTVLTPVFTYIAYAIKPANTTWISIVIALFPVICSLFVWVLACIFGKRKYGLSYLLAIYQGEVKRNRTYEVLNVDEPTVYEFKKWMQDISDYIETNNAPKLVIVFDNMDRLPSEKVKELWSSIHTFFADGGFKNIWAIIPFDEKHLSCAFGNEKEDNSFAREVTKLFIKKTFPIVYRVAPPVITDYKIVFDKLFVEAFGTSVDFDSRETINRVFRIEKPSTNVRDIISFINEMVALKQEWGESISIENIALFCLEKEQILNDPVNEILSGSYLLNTNSIIDNSIQLQSEMAALVYGVAVEHAQQIPLTKYIENCINKEHGYDINQYAESNVHFDMVLKYVVENMDTASVDKIIHCLNKLRRESTSVHSIWKYLFLKKLGAPIEKQEFSMEYKALLLHLDSDMQNIIISRLYQEILHFTNFKGAYYFNALYEMDQFIKENGLSCDFRSIIQEKEVTPSTFIEFVQAANREQIVFSDHEDTIMCDGYRIKTNSESLDNYLAELKFNHIDVLRAIKKSSSYGFPKLLQAVTDCVEEQIVNKNNAGVIFATYRILSKNKRLLEETLNLSLINQIYSDLESDGKDIQHSGYYDFVAMKIANNQPVSLIEGGEIKYVADVIDYYIDYGVLLLKSLTFSSSLLTDLLAYMVENNLGWNLLLTDVLPKFEEIKEEINVTDEALLNNLSNWDFESIGKDNITEYVPNASFYAVTSRVDNALSKHINQVAIEALSEESVDSLYSQRMNLKDYWIVVISYLLDKMDSLPDNLVEFCKKIFRNIASGSQDPVQLPDYLKAMINRLDNRGIISTIIDIRNRFCNGVQAINPTKFQFFESYFRLYGSLIETAVSVVNQIMLPVIEDEACRSLILQHQDFYINLINKVGDSSFEIKKRFREIITLDSSSELVDFVETIDPNPRAEDSSESK
ncbi:P-loop NTPase fold protein [Barnesiella intestinihominis]|uniref:P-loop NTPase fold protein n=1 Tax=Barnesiella intestinihominis TaxID=487174 RepID=UPI003AB27944